MSSSHSTVLTPIQMVAFLAAEEGANKPTRQRQFQSEVLHSILFNGPIVADFPPELLKGPTYDRLISEGLLQLHDMNCSDKLFQHARYAYETAFDSFRALEESPEHSPFISLDVSGKRDKSDSIELADHYSRIEFGTKQLDSILNPLLDGMQSIFGHYLDQSILVFSKIASLRMKDIGLEQNEDFDPQEPIAHIWKEMGLSIRSAEEIDSESGGLGSTNFSPGDFDEFKENFYRLFSTKFLDHMKVQLSATWAKDARKNMLISIFWKTVFDLYNTAQFSKTNEGILILPKNINPLRDNSEKPCNPDLVRIYKLYLSERGAMPVLNSIDDLLRLREDKGLNQLRENLKVWRNVGTDSDAKMIGEVRKDIALAVEKIKWVRTEARVGRIIGYLSLPIGIADMFMGTPFSLVAGAVSIAMDKATTHKVGKLSWLNFGLETVGKKARQ